ncbi:transcription termination/antitermination protein NusG [Brevundimonas sp.]|uniref:transcription termination/antitermination protein NusG n=1 Tax=Brevundimonas sp. TaxID=1871086 RepID=UPI0024883A71|nr:transcription termination/antitermination protein NusG [Brevundimonas sp.]MDI1281602.1 transcription termination/antitermination protein NusG [Brevundimonas sp.]
MTDAAPETKPAANPRHKWYIIHAYSNFEKKVSQHIQDQARQQGLTECFSEILVPTEEVVEIRRGRKINAERKFFPGYVLAKMEMTDEAYHLVKNTPKVTGFLGAAGGTKPLPVSEREVQNIIGQVEEGVERPKPTIRFDIGETVKVIDGPFASFEGQVESVDEDNARLRVAVSIFGRPTPVDLEYNQVEKNAG